MPYYNKEEVEKEIKKHLNFIDENREKYYILTPIQQTLSQISNEEELVSFFYIEKINHETDLTKKSIDFLGKSFARIDHDLYTDDRFALDMIKASKEGKTVIEIIKERKNESYRA